MASAKILERVIGDWALVRLGSSPLDSFCAGIVEEASHGTRPIPKGRAFLAKFEPKLFTFEDRPGSFAFVPEESICAILSEGERAALAAWFKKEDDAWKPAKPKQ